MKLDATAEGVYAIAPTPSIQRGDQGPLREGEDVLKQVGPVIASGAKQSTRGRPWIASSLCSSQ
jgi:hypothetical protein